MENKRLKLPKGIHTFEKIRTDGRVYVDKTKYLVDIIENINVCFLARPRRFGKSLTVSTLEALFEGRKELFKGLYAEEFLNRPEFKSSPVIMLDMSLVDTISGIKGLKQSLKQILLETADNLDVEVSKDMLASEIFRNIIVETSKKHNQKVVILIDEYDAPYTDFFNNPVMANKVRGELRNLYKQMKANDRYIRFIFLTGISKFARFGVFSSLNTTTDISPMPEYAGLCGYTEEEIIRYFPDYLEDTAKKMDISTDELITKMRNYYNGFCFDRDLSLKIYNPFSTLGFFLEKVFADYWFETGTPKVIADYMKNRHLTIGQFRNLYIPDDFARSPGDVDTTPPEGFLYQCGYLTLHAKKENGFLLDYPNTEVLNAMSALVVNSIMSDRDESFNLCSEALLDGLRETNPKKVVAAFNRLLAVVPYDDYAKTAKNIISNSVYDSDDAEKERKSKEWIYRTKILCFLHGCGLKVLAEIHGNLGRSDMVIFHGGNTWVIEFKVSYKDRGHIPEKRAEEALKQIEKMNYAEPYPNAICVGIAIDDEKRLITAYKVKDNG